MVQPEQTYSHWAGHFYNWLVHLQPYSKVLPPASSSSEGIHCLSSIQQSLNFSSAFDNSQFRNQRGRHFNLPEKPVCWTGFPVRCYIFFLKTGVLIQLSRGHGRGARGGSAPGGWSLGLVGSCACVYPNLAQPGDELLGEKRNWKGTNHK